MYSLLLALTLAPGQAPKPHVEANPLYKELLEKGLVIGADLRVKLPAPTMPDGLSVAKQTAVINDQIGTDYSFDEFTRKATVAPQILKIRNVDPSDPKAPTRGADFWFVAHGDFNATDDEKFVDRALNAGRETSSGAGKQLSTADLAKRGIRFTAENEKRERYGSFQGDFLEKVRIKGVGRVMWSKTAESVVAVGLIDPRFNGDSEHPNEWRSIVKEGGEVKIGEAHPYSGAGFYLKITKLGQPGGAMFVEQHIVFAEPGGWFDGANLLRAKLPIAVQSTVRAMRREWAKTGK